VHAGRRHTGHSRTSLLNTAQFRTDINVLVCSMLRVSLQTVSDKSLVFCVMFD
jgi:hypothetical protein